MISNTFYAIARRCKKSKHGWLFSMQIGNQYGTWYTNHPDNAARYNNPYFGATLKRGQKWVHVNVGLCGTDVVEVKP